MSEATERQTYLRRTAVRELAALRAVWPSGTGGVHFEAHAWLLRLMRTAATSHGWLLTYRLYGHSCPIILHSISFFAFAVLAQQKTFSRDDYKLRSELIGLKLDKERLEQEKEEADKREQDLKERVSLLEEMVQIKDELVIKMTNQVRFIIIMPSFP